MIFLNRCKVRLPALPFILIALLLLAAPVQAVETMDAEVYARADRLLAPNLYTKVKNRLTIPHWLGDRDEFWYRHENAEGHDFIRVNASTGEKTALFDHAAIAGALSALLNQAFKANSLPFDDLQWLDTPADDQQAFEIIIERQRIQCRVSPDGCETIATLPAVDAAPSPDGRWAVFTYQNNLWLRDLQTGAERALSTDGIEDFGFGIYYDNWLASFAARSQLGEKLPPMVYYWAPDSSRVMITRLDQRHLAEYPFVDHAPQDSFHPKLYPVRMAFPGEQKPLTEYWVFDVASGERRQLQTPDDLIWMHQDMHALRKVWWSSDSTHLYAAAHGSHLRSAYLLDFDLVSGEFRTVIREELPPRTDMNSTSYNPPAVAVLGDLDQVIWWSQRDGWGHLYRYDGQSGELLNQITEGEWLVRDLLSVNEAEGTVYFSGAGKEAGNPYYRYLYRIGLDGDNLQLLSPESADHLLTGPGDYILTIDQAQPYTVVSPSGDYAVYNYSRVDQPGRAVIRNTRDASLVTEFEQADASVLFALGWQPPEEFMVKADDGSELWGVLYKPSDFDPDKRYPIIDAQYASPLTAVAPRNFGMAIRQRSPQSPSAVAELGFVVMTLDARGTTYRSREFSQHGFGKLNRIGLDDHVSAIRQLAAKHSFIDVDRVGIYGHSYGGYAATRAMLEYPEFFKVAVAGAGPATLQSIYQDYHWSAYQGAPVYADGSEIQAEPVEIAGNWASLDARQQAARLQGNLLIMLGDMDENVPPSSILQFIDALVAADKDFDMLYLPGRDHQFAEEGYVVRRLWDYFVRNLKGVEPPQYRITTTGR
jgi:dipeptidyl-peptidase-4